MEEKIIKVLKSSNDFLNTIRQLIKDKYDVKEIHNSPKELVLEGKFNDGYYLLITDTTIILLNKVKKINSGYLYNTTTYDVQTLFTWKLVSYEVEPEIKITKCLNTSEELPKKLSEKPRKRTKKPKSSTPSSFAKFDLSRLGNNAKICIIGKRGSGKSWVVRKLVETLNKSPDYLENTLIMAPTETYTKFHTKNFPQAKILTGYDIDHVQENLRDHIDGCIVYDDCLSVKPHPEIENVLCDTKYWAKSFILALQFANDISHKLTKNCDYIFLLREDFYNNKKKYYDLYGKMFSTFEQFNEVFGQLTQNYGCMIIDMKSKSDNVLEKVFSFNAMDKEQIDNIPQSKFKEFNINSLNHAHNNICVFGKRGSGKKELCEQIINKLMDPVNLIVSSKENPNPFECKIYPNAQRETDFDDKVVEKYLENQNQGCIILDNCVISKTSTESLGKLLKDGRHYNKSSITMMQCPLGLSPEIRSNFTFIFIFYDDFLQNQKRYYEHYCKVFPTFEDFKLAFEQIPKYGCMVIDNRKGPKTIDIISYYNPDK
jgi:uridine kinase